MRACPLSYVIPALTKVALWLSAVARVCAQSGVVAYTQQLLREDAGLFGNGPQLATRGGPPPCATPSSSPFRRVKRQGGCVVVELVGI